MCHPTPQHLVKWKGSRRGCAFLPPGAAQNQRRARWRRTDLPSGHSFLKKAPWPLLQLSCCLFGDGTLGWDPILGSACAQLLRAPSASASPMQNSLDEAQPALQLLAPSVSLCGHWEMHSRWKDGKSWLLPGLLKPRGLRGRCPGIRSSQSMGRRLGAVSAVCPRDCGSALTEYLLPCLP